MSTNLYPNKLKHFRLKRKLTQQAVANRLGHKSANRLSAWEHGSAKPAIENLIKLSTLYGVAIEKLYPALITNTRPQQKRMPGEAAMTSLPEYQLEAMTTEQQLETLAEMIVEAYFDSMK